MPTPKIYQMTFKQIYEAYVNKVTRKARSEDDLRQTIYWLTGYSDATLNAQIENGVTMAAFFEQAPALNPRADAVTGVICGVRVETITEPLMRKIRILDKLVDELARGWSLEKIRR